MAYIHAETFEMLDSPGKPQNTPRLAKHYNVDDLIALPVQILDLSTN